MLHNTRLLLYREGGSIYASGFGPGGSMSASGFGPNPRGGGGGSKSAVTPAPTV